MITVLRGVEVHLAGFRKVPGLCQGIGELQVKAPQKGVIEPDRELQTAAVQARSVFEAERLHREVGAAQRVFDRTFGAPRSSQCITSASASAS